MKMQQFKKRYFGQSLRVGLQGTEFYPPKLAESYTETEQQQYMAILNHRRSQAILRTLKKANRTNAATEYAKALARIYA